MPSKKKINNDEIDLIELIKIILQNKFQILIIMIISLVSTLGLNYSKITEKNFKITIDFSILYHTARVEKLCGTDLKCKKLHTTKEILRAIGSEWNYDDRAEQLYLITTSPLETNYYFKKFENQNQIMTDEIYNSTIHDIENLETLFNKDLSLPRELADHYRLKYSLDNGKKVLYIGQPRINKLTQKITNELIIGLVLGTLISLIYIVVQRVYVKLN